MASPILVACATWWGMTAVADSVASAPTRATKSFSQCSGQTFSENEWAAKSCYFKNICFDANTNNFKFFAGEAQGASSAKPTFLVTETSVGPNTKNPSARGLMQTNRAVSLGPLAMVFKNRIAYKWQPEIVESDIPKGVFWDDSSPVFALFMSYIGHNIGHFIFDELYAVYNLLKMFGLLTTDVQLLSFINFNDEYPHHQQGVNLVDILKSKYGKQLFTHIIGVPM
jgi:hypothetical protein